MMDKNMEQILKFMEAQQAAEEKYQPTFECPLCGAEAWWSRSSYNNHLHCGCQNCGFRMME